MATGYGSFDGSRALPRKVEADDKELLILAKKIPERIRQRVLERPDAFSRLAELDDETLDRVLKQVEGKLASGDRQRGG